MLKVVTPLAGALIALTGMAQAASYTAAEYGFEFSLPETGVFQDTTADGTAVTGGFSETFELEAFNSALGTLVSAQIIVTSAYYGNMELGIAGGDAAGGYSSSMSTSYDSVFINGGGFGGSGSCFSGTGPGSCPMSFDGELNSSGDHTWNAADWLAAFAVSQDLEMTFSASVNLTSGVGPATASFYTLNDEFAPEESRFWSAALIYTYEPLAAAVPLPAAGWMLLAGLGGIAALRRRKG